LYPGGEAGSDEGIAAGPADNPAAIAHYTLFTLSDAESFLTETAGDIIRRFGILRSDYSPKPAFESYRLLIANAEPR
jgi:hypothetical protein